MKYELWIDADYHGSFDSREDARRFADKELPNYGGEPVVQVNEVSQWS